MSVPKLSPRLVVGISGPPNASEDLEGLFLSLPSDAGMAFLFTHQPLSGPRAARTPSTPLRVREAEHDLPVEPNHIYLLHSERPFVLHDGKLVIRPTRSVDGVKPPAEHLFHSLAREFGARSVVIVLPGATDEEKRGVRDVKAAGGLTIELAAPPEVSPLQAAFQPGLVDLTLRPPEIASTLERFSQLPSALLSDTFSDDEGQPPTRRPTALAQHEWTSLTELLDGQMSVDLRVYKPATIERRVRRRVALSGLPDFSTYLEHLGTFPKERDLLVGDLLIGVTEFFRDPQAFQALREQAMLPLVEAAAPNTTLRAWVAGCATGEEAYSLAMDLLDVIEASKKNLRLQIFATDLDQEALSRARSGVYSAAIAHHVGPKRLEKYFRVLDDQGYQVLPVLRDVISFAMHDLTKDPPFSRMHFVSCRNVLIYLNARAQRHVLRALHFALETDGHLMLSPSECTGSQKDLFKTLSKRHRIYRKAGPSLPLAIGRARSASERPSLSLERITPNPARALTANDMARRAVVDAFAPPTLVVAEDGSIVFAHGDLERFVQMPQGDHPRFELGSVLRSPLGARARAAISKCRSNKARVTSELTIEESGTQVRLQVLPAQSLGDGVVILSFEALDDADRNSADLPDRSDTPEQDAVVLQLERELQAVREDLRHTVEDLESSNEELRSTNEEYMSMNEELQSANEELESTTEELRSLNDELTTVNSQLRENIEHLEHAHDDLNNFFLSTKVATVFFDEKLRVKRFTPAAAELLDLDDSSLGQDLPNISRELLQHDFDQETAAVLDDLAGRSSTFRTNGHRWFTRTVLPYRTATRRIEGVVVTYSDVTDLHSANEELTIRARRLELAWEAARGGVFEHRIPFDDSTYISEQWAHVLGHREDELSELTDIVSWLAEQAHPDDRQTLECAYADVIAGRADRYSIELRFRHKAGHYIWVRKISKVLARDEQGRARHLLRMMIDITDLKHTELALKESETRFREMANGLPLMVWVHDETGQPQYVNATFGEYYGVTLDDVTGGRWRSLLHPDDAQGWTESFYDAFHKRLAFHSEGRVQHADGSWRWIESWGRPRFSEEGQFHGYIGTSVDITERRQLEGVLRESEDRFRNLADNITQLAWTCDHLGVATWYNQRWYEYTGQTWDEMRGIGWLKLLHPEHAERVTDGLKSALAADAPWEDTFPLLGADKQYRWFLSRAVPIRDESGQLVRWFGTNTDVTDLRMIEERLVAADKQKDEFLAMLGHELRNPLAAVRTAAELLKVQGEREPGLLRTQQIIERQTAHMAALLDGLLDVARMIRGKIQLEREPLDLAAVCREITADYLAGAQARHVVLSTVVPDQPVWLLGDRVRLTQIIGNLLANALKYTPQGGRVTIQVGSEDGHAVLQVADTGQGIPADLLPHVFEPFWQGEQSMDRSQGGLGLGLALVKNLTELHGGSVRATSEGHGKGTRVTVHLPLSSSSVRSASESPVIERAPLRLVLIEDNEDSAEMLQQMLGLAGHSVGVANSGPQGIALMHERQPDAVICDLGLPEGMSGFDVARQVRGDKRLQGIKLLALSGYGRSEDKARSIEAGFDVHLTKPIDIGTLQRVLREVTETPSDVSSP